MKVVCIVLVFCENGIQADSAEYVAYAWHSKHCIVCIVIVCKLLANLNR